jgi:hypothetical protein
LSPVGTGRAGSNDPEATVRPLQRRILLPLTALCLSALGGAAGVSFLLEAGADRARVGEAVADDAELLAKLGASARPGHAGCAGVLVRELIGCRPYISFIRVEDGRGAVVAETGDREAARDWVDRTFATGGGPVRVRVGYRPRARPVAYGVRAGAWTVLTGGFLLALLGVAALLLRRHVLAPLESVTAWMEGGGERPTAGTSEIERLVKAAQGRIGDSETGAP